MCYTKYTSYVTALLTYKNVFYYWKINDCSTENMYNSLKLG